jgi:AraC-like DNA-binding protein
VKPADARIPIDTYLLIQDEAAVYVDDPYFGLHMGEYAKAGSWSILGYLMMNCASLGEAFEKSTRYQRIIGNLIEGGGRVEGDRITVTLHTPPHAPEMSRHCFEATLSSSVRLMRTLTGSDLSPLQVTFEHAAPESTAEYERVFRCPVRFDHEETSFTLDFAMLQTPILFANPDLLAYFEDYAQTFLTQLESKREYTRAVAKIILSRMDDERLSVQKVANELAVSVRTLQLKLKDEGVAFSELHRDIRRRLAMQYLRQNYSVEDITYLLGYSEPSVFRKAFKRWSGLTPGQYRAEPFTALP